MWGLGQDVDLKMPGAASSLPSTTTGTPPSAAKLAVDSGVACVAPWAKAAGGVLVDIRANHPTSLNPTPKIVFPVHN